MNWRAITFDSNSPVPIYRQLRDRLAGWIRDGTLADGDRLPPTRELAGLLGVNRTTVAAAYGALESEGLLKAHVGRGSYVRAPGAARPVRFDWEPRLRSSVSERPVAQAWWPVAPDAVNFSAWQQEPQAWALAAVHQAAAEELASRGPAILRLGPAEGFGPLREYLWSAMQVEGIARSGDELLVTNGCQQGLDLVAKVLAAPGETVVVEDPVYPGARDLFLAAGVQVRGVPVGPSGLSIAALEQELARGRPRFFVVTPSFQNPTGATLPLEARREILRLAARYGTPVVENDVYAGLRYRGEPLPPLKALDSDGLVIYLRSFAKAAFAGLRVGWCVAPRPVARRLAAAKQLTDLHTDQLSQAVLYRLAAGGALDRHLAALRRQGAQRLAAALEACRSQLPEVEVWTPEGGAHLWLRLPEPFSAAELLVQARRQKVVFTPGEVFAVGRPHRAALRLSFAGLEPDRIRRGIAVLGGLLAAEAAGVRAGGEASAPALV